MHNVNRHTTVLDLTPYPNCQLELIDRTSYSSFDLNVCRLKSDRRYIVILHIFSATHHFKYAFMKNSLGQKKLSLIGTPLSVLFS